MYYSRKKQNKKGPKILKLFFLIFILYFVWQTFFSYIKLDQKIEIKKWDTFQTFVQDLSILKKLWIKIYLFFNSDELDFSKIQEWTYTFDWKYSKSNFLKTINDGPKQEFLKYSVLEWWSIYDIDLDLFNKWFIEKWEYIALVSEQEIINKYKNRYDFLQNIWNINSLEGFLYPDTYHLDKEWNVADQLVYLQLDNFKNKIWKTYSGDIQKFNKLSLYEIITLASILEKEEKNNKNKPTVAWIFFNRLDNWMRIDADITLCYWLYQAYEICTPKIIVQKIYDKSNIFNTRQNYGLTPSPISNPDLNSILSVINYKKTEYFYYLHDNSGNIYYWKTLSDHESNKNKYLK